MNTNRRYSNTRNGYRVEVYEYTQRGAPRFMARVTNLTTGADEQTPGWSSYATTLEVAQEMADKGNI